MVEPSLLEIAIDSIGDPILMHDANFRVLRVNRAVAERLGVTFGALSGKPLNAVLPQNGRAWQRCPYCENAAGDAVEHDAAFGGYLLASTARFRDPANGTQGTVHVLRDVSGRRRAEQKYRELFENVQEGVFISTPQGRFLDFNDAFLRIMGYASRDELLRVDIGATLYVNPQDRENLKHLLTRHGAVNNYEFQMRRANGEIITVMESSHVSRDAHGNVVAYQGFVVDVTARKHTERELLERNQELTRLHEETRVAYENLRRTQEQLLQSEKMAAVGQLISGVAHELNNPLTAILGYSQLLSDSGEVTPTGADFAGKIYRQAQRTHRIVQNLLSFSRQRPPERRPVDLNQVVEDTLALREYDLKLSNIAIHREFESPLPPASGDPHQLQQVFLNILNNAVDAILEHAGRGDIWIRTCTSGERLVVEFMDSGPGVKDPARVFDPFYTTKPVGKGTGLGLSICYGIVKEHGGMLQVRNEPPLGAAFQISLPVTAAGDDAQSDAGPVTQMTSAARILLVDDEESVLDLQQEILRGRCLWTRAARNGQQAIEFLKRETVDLIVTDLKMPGEISGREIHRWVSQHRPELVGRVIFTMSDAQGPDVQKLLAETGCLHIQKPFHLQDFLGLIQQALSDEPARLLR